MCMAWIFQVGFAGSEFNQSIQFQMQEEGHDL